jgi:hypothetical protein
MRCLGRYSHTNDFANDGVRRRNEVMGEWCGHLRRQSPRGDKMVSKMNILIQKSVLNKF